MTARGTGLARPIIRWMLAVVYLVAGVLHLITPQPFLTITPDWVPFPATVVIVTGLAEIAGAAGLVQPFWRELQRAAAVGLAAYAVCVFPANINHFAMDMARSDGGLGLAYHVPRMFAQPIVVWLTLWAGQVTDWPFSRRTR